MESSTSFTHQTIDQLLKANSDTATLSDAQMKEAYDYF